MIEYTCIKPSLRACEKTGEAIQKISAATNMLDCRVGVTHLLAMTRVI